MLLHQINLVGGLPFDVRVPPAPKSVTARSREELHEMLNVGFEQIAAGKVVGAGVVMDRLRDER